MACAAPVLHGPDEVLESFCSWSDGRLYFAPPTGGRWELITSATDPAVPNPGDGSFHAMPAATVRDAIAALDYPLDDLRFEIYVLPYPRRGQFPSATSDGVIYLSPATRPYAAAVVHGVVAHEIGHVVHRAYLRDQDRDGWNRYATMRGFDGDARYSETAAHAFRPREIFAEDFRALFGSDLAQESGSLENAELVWPEQVSGLEDFLRSLPERRVAEAPLLAWPNPFQSQVRFTVGPAPVHGWQLAVYDVRGRRVRSLAVNGSGSSPAEVAWDGRDAQGRRVAHGAYFARLVPPPGAAPAPVATAKLVLLP